MIQFEWKYYSWAGHDAVGLEMRKAEKEILRLGQK
jgi:hypothetical protein